MRGPVGAPSTGAIVDLTTSDPLLASPHRETVEAGTNTRGGGLSKQQHSLTFGQLIRRRRNELGLSLVDVAAHSGIDDSYWSKLENDRVSEPSPRTLQRVARTLGIDAIDLYALCGYELSERLPELQPYLRAKYELPPEAIADLERYFAQLRAYYGIPEAQPVFPPRKLAAPTEEGRQARAALTRARNERDQLDRRHERGELPEPLYSQALADSDERIRRAESRLDGLDDSVGAAVEDRR